MRQEESATGSDGAGTVAEPVRRRPANPVRRWVLIVLAVAIALFLYSLIADRLTPYTPQATVQAFVVRLAPEVAGRVVEVSVADNQPVQSGEILFMVDPEPYEIAVERAAAELAAAGQSIGANTAGVSAAEQRVVEVRAELTNVREQTARIFELVQKGVYAQARADQARASLDKAEAGVLVAQADLERARQELGPKGEDNPEIRRAGAVLAQARLDLIRTAIIAPSDGVVTNLQLSLGQFAAVGEPAMTFIDARSVWVTANLRENSLEHVRPDARVDLVFDVLPGQVFRGRVESVGWGVAGGDLDPETGLPEVRNQTGWIRDPQRFPVRIELEREGHLRGLRYGSQANVIVYTGDNPVVNAIGWFWIRLIGILTYVT